MSKRIELEGKKFGLLTVAEYLGDGKYSCKCECGKECVVLGDNLKRGHTTSCGCAKAKTDNLVGKSFGRLTVLSTYRVGGRTMCKCECECGNKKNIRADSLTDRSSCGCLASEIHSELAQKTISAVNSNNIVQGTNVRQVKRALKGAKQANNTSGYTGVSYNKRTHYYQAYIKFRKKLYYLGSFAHKEDAVKVREEAERQVFGDFLKWYEDMSKNQEKSD